MGSEEVGVVRGVGKRAQWILRRMAAGEGLWEEKEVQEEEVGDGEDGDKEDGDGEDGDVDEEQLEGAEEDGVPGGPGSHTLEDEEDDSALAEARKRVIASLGSAEPARPPLRSKAVQDHPEEENVASTEPQADAVASGPAKAEKTDLNSVHAALDIIVTIIGACYGQRDLLDGRLLWEELEWMNSEPEPTWAERLAGWEAIMGGD